MDVSRINGKAQYIDSVIIKHEHPVWTGGETDAFTRKMKGFINKMRELI